MMSQPASPARIAVCLGLLLAGCAGHAPAPRVGGAASPPDAAGDRIPSTGAVRERSPGEQAAVVAVRQVGIPYRYGGTDRSGFDCSGLVQYAWASAGKRIPRTTARQWHALRPVAQTDMRTGDVLFFRISGKVSHVGMYLGDGRFVHAPATGREVTVTSLDAPYYQEAFVRAGRP